MYIIFLFLLFTLLPLYSAEKNSGNRKAKIAKWLQELHIDEEYCFAFSGKQIRCTDNEKVIKMHGDPQCYIKLALENLAKEYQILVDIKNTLENKQKKFVDEKKQSLNKSFILQKLQRSHKKRPDKTLNGRITFFQALIKKFEYEKYIFESFKDQKDFSERNIVQIFRFLPGDFGAFTVLVSEEREILSSHRWYQMLVDKYSDICFTPNSKSEFHWIHPRYISSKNQHYSLALPYRFYGPWVFLLASLPNSYNIDADPRVKKLPIYATEEQKKAAIYENPFAKKYDWIPMKALVNAESE